MDKTAETNAALADRFAAEVWNNGNLDLTTPVKFTKPTFCE
jgi:hypothetical protein